MHLPAATTDSRALNKRTAPRPRAVNQGVGSTPRNPLTHNIFLPPTFAYS